ncbi:hypothetical protein BBF96_06835 [Anoxybacter fermentans]|uniref:SAM-dependent methyltransferase n=1 Tax=Anoxybacter fermentans TaxID=1323375 RepID=A0A3Q9HQA4_9FIRM|nr:class I SAM-dependent methyltransferase [Anoxybacter fermentans]AZR73124.1 hypothetical protein BBF96_06835 [Anoxybacter fermentans]
MLSKRLRQIIELIPDGVGVADIGTDHAQIPIYLARHTRCYPIIAGEKNSGPFQTALQRIRESGMEKLIDLRQGSGLTILRPGEVDWAVIAGMGFKTIIEIIEEAEGVARSLKGLILQPMQKPEELRRWLVENKFQITDEMLVKEDGKLFQIILVQSGQSEKMDEIFYEIGPVLFKKGTPYLTEHIEALISYHQEVLGKIKLGQGKRAQTRIDELKTKIRKFKEVLNQWQRRYSE